MTLWGMYDWLEMTIFILHNLGSKNEQNGEAADIFSKKAIRRL